MCAKKAHRGESCGRSCWYVSKSTTTRDLARKSTTWDIARSSVYETFAMIPIDINDLLPKELDLAMLARDARSTPPDPKTHDGGDATTQAALELPSQNRPTEKF